MNEFDNIANVCQDCIDKKKEQVIHDYKIGDIIKGQFFSKSRKGELMWVIVHEIKENTIIGTLDNDPVQDFDIKYGDFVEVKKENIVQVWRM